MRPGIVSSKTNMWFTSPNMPSYRARQEQRLFGISERDYKAWRAHLHSAKRRGIPFGFSLHQWCLWWQHELLRTGGERGLGPGKRMMCRIDGDGPYVPTNVYCGTAQSNTDDWKAAGAKRYCPPEKLGRPHLGKRGDKHPRAKPVITPRGRYGSAALAAEAHGITRQCASRRAKHHKKGWRWADTGSNASCQQNKH